MHLPRHRRGRPLATRVALASLKGAGVGGLLTVVVVNGLSAGAPSATPAATPPASEHRGVVARAVVDHRCSYDGYGARAVPGSALIRTDAGRVRLVSFDVGWDVYNGRRPGTLIAVCLDPTERPAPS